MIENVSVASVGLVAVTVYPATPRPDVVMRNDVGSFSVDSMPWRAVWSAPTYVFLSVKYVSIAV